MVNFTTQSIVSDVTYGLGLLSSFGANVDVVGIYSNGASSSGSSLGGITSSIVNSVLGTKALPAFGQLFSNARPLKATVRETSKVMQHPTETGSTISDFHIINPVEIDIPMIVSSQFYASTYSQIRQNYINATLLSVKTRTGVYSNMIIADMPHEEEPEMFDSIVIGLRLIEVLSFIQGTNTLQNDYQPLNPLNSNTILSGLQQGVALAGKLLTSGESVASYASAVKRFF